MGEIMTLNLDQINKNLRDKSPADIVAWALSIAKNPLVTTNFRPYEAAILNVTTKAKRDIKVVWCDTGYNTPNTYQE